MSDEFLQLALELLSRDADALSSVRTRRAFSTAYYALFHALARSNADTLVGPQGDRASWVRVYRALEHAAAKRVLSQLRSTPHPELSYFARVFVGVQEQRHAADYDPDPTFAGEDAMFILVLAREAHAQFAMLPASLRLDLATQLLFKSRP